MLNRLNEDCANYGRTLNLHFAQFPISRSIYFPPPVGDVGTQSVSGPEINRSRVRGPEVVSGGGPPQLVTLFSAGESIASRMCFAYGLCLVAGPSCRAHSREIRALSSLCYVHTYWDVFIMAFVYVFASCMRDTRGCAPSRNVVEPAAQTRTYYIPGAVHRNSVDAGRTTDERADEFLSPEKNARRGKSFTPRSLCRLRAFLAVESSECFPLRYRVLNAYLFTRDRTAGFDSAEETRSRSDRSRAVIKYSLARSW